MRMFALASVILASLAVVATPTYAQNSTHAATQTALDAVVQQHVDAAAADRAVVARLLERADVQKIAGDAGLDLRTAQSAIATLSPGELAQVAAQARQAEQALAGGQSSVTISTTMIIIGLLVLILLIVALN
jgi:hypothetical protein